ncbi:MAG: hypothetical protein CVU64_07850 [Deltaproteobacteria bacterium HGW-Deltaproteobacteria-21]|nr:MAG: hypothetical protein CVU64_07850 [Deltaproteobacteria bacterium HGW-Deltaproteobacteria-21]
MIKKKQILVNATMSLVQVLATGFSMFLLYRYLLRQIGVENLGVWSVVLATTSVASIVKKGTSGPAVKFVARYLAHDKMSTASRVIQTTVLTLGFFAALTLLLTYPLAKYALALVVPPTHLSLAYSLLPYSFLSLWIMVVASVYAAGLDGCQRTDLRSWVFTLGSLFLLIASYFLVPSWGLLGLAYAQVGQSLFVLLTAWALLRNQMPSLPFLPHKWDRNLFGEMFAYGLNFQVVSIFQLLYDPITKALLTKFGGISMTGYYEMASRMITEFRGLIVAANQVLFPTIADLYERKLETVGKLYKDTYSLVLFISLPLYMGVMALSPVISMIWIGHYEQTFVAASLLLGFGFFVNTLVGPVYFTNLGTGKLKWNTIGHAGIGILNLVLGSALGWLFGGFGVIASWTISLVAGSFVMLFMSHKELGIPLGVLLPHEHIVITFASFVGMVFGFALCSLMIENVNPILIALIVSIAYVCAVAWPAWAHPLRPKILHWATESLRKV